MTCPEHFCGVAKASIKQMMQKGSQELWNIYPGLRQAKEGTVGLIHKTPAGSKTTNR